MVPDDLKDTCGLAVGGACYKAYVEWHESDRWKALEAKGALRQRLLFASTGTKDPGLSDYLYVSGLAAPDTVNTMPDKTLKAFLEHGTSQLARWPRDGAPSLDCDSGEDRRLRASIFTRLGEELQVEGASKFDDSWQALLADIESKTAAMS